MPSKSKKRFNAGRSPRRTPFRSSQRIKNPLLTLWKKHQESKDPDLIYDLAKKYSLTVLDDEALDFLKRYHPIIEIEAENGYISYLLNQIGIDIVAFDKKPSKEQWTLVKIGNSRHVKYFPRRNLLLNWPNPNNESGYNAIKHFNETTKANHFIFLGEYKKTKGSPSNNKYTSGTDKFYQYLEKNFSKVAEKKLPNWKLTETKLIVFEKHR